MNREGEDPTSVGYIWKRIREAPSPLPTGPHRHSGRGDLIHVSKGTSNQAKVADCRTGRRVVPRGQMSPPTCRPLYGGCLLKFTEPWVHLLFTFSPGPCSLCTQAPDEAIFSGHHHLPLPLAVLSLGPPAEGLPGQEGPPLCGLSSRLPTVLLASRPG